MRHSSTDPFHCVSFLHMKITKCQINLAKVLKININIVKYNKCHQIDYTPLEVVCDNSLSWKGLKLSLKIFVKQIQEIWAKPLQLSQPSFLSATHTETHTSVHTDGSSSLSQYRIPATNVEWLLPLHRLFVAGEIDHTHDIRNEMACHMELFYLLLLGERERSHSTSVPDIGFLTTRVTMYVCLGLETRATAWRARWMMINHLIYEWNSLSVSCFLTCNNVTTPEQLRKMPGKHIEGCSLVNIQYDAVGRGI